MNEKDLRALIAEQASLLMTEQETEEVPGGDEPDAPSADSVDVQIDELLLQYEKLSIPDDEPLQEVLTTTSLRFILEQEEQEEVDVEAEVPAESVSAVSGHPRKCCTTRQHCCSRIHLDHLKTE